MFTHAHTSQRVRMYVIFFFFDWWYSKSSMVVSCFLYQPASNNPNSLKSITSSQRVYLYCSSHHKQGWPLLERLRSYLCSIGSFGFKHFLKYVSFVFNRDSQLVFLIARNNSISLDQRKLNLNIM